MSLRCNDKTIIYEVLVNIFHGLQIREIGEYEQIDNDTLKKLKAIQELDNDTKAHKFATIDAFIKAAKLKNIAAM